MFIILTSVTYSVSLSTLVEEQNRLLHVAPVYLRADIQNFYGRRSIEPERGKTCLSMNADCNLCHQRQKSL